MRKNKIFLFLSSQTTAGLWIINNRGVSISLDDNKTEIGKNINTLLKQSNYWNSSSMKYLDLRISNWSSYRTFQEALGKIGWEHFSVLKAELPEGNSGSIILTLSLNKRVSFSVIPDS